MSLTPQEVLTLQTERLWRLGEIRMSTNYPNPQEMIAGHTVSRLEEESDRNSSAESDRFVTAAMAETHDAVQQLQEENELLQANKAAVAAVESEIDNFLLASGKSKRFVAAHDPQTKLRQAIEMTSPKQALDTVTVLVMDPFLKQDLQLNEGFKPVNLLLGAYVDEVYTLLRTVMKAESLFRCNDTGEDPQAWENKDIVWKYQLIAKDDSSVLQPGSIKLETDDDWKRLRRCIVGTGTKASKALQAVLTCVCR